MSPARELKIECPGMESAQMTDVLIARKDLHAKRERDIVGNDWDLGFHCISKVARYFFPPVQPTFKA
jgi:hypothetical protein